MARRSAALRRPTRSWIAAEATITPGVVEMACRVNLSATSFLKAAAVLERTAQVKLSGERLRQEVEAAGRRVLKAQQDNAIAVTWHAKDCVVPEGQNAGKTRVFTRAATASWSPSSPKPRK